MTITKHVDGLGEVTGIGFNEVNPGTILSRKDIKYGAKGERIYYMTVITGGYEYGLMRLDNFEVITSKAWLGIPFEIVRSEIIISDHNLTK